MTFWDRIKESARDAAARPSWMRAGVTISEDHFMTYAPQPKKCDDCGGEVEFHERGICMGMRPLCDGCYSLWVWRGGMKEGDEVWWAHCGSGTGVERRIVRDVEFAPGETTIFWIECQDGVLKGRCLGVSGRHLFQTEAQALAEVRRSDENVAAFWLDDPDYLNFMPDARIEAIKARLAGYERDTDQA